MSEGSPSAGSVSVGTPLAGKRVVNTRAFPQAGELDGLLVAHGAIPLSYPCIAIQTPADVAPLSAAVEWLTEGAFEWVVLTSANTVESIAARIADQPMDETDRPWRGALRGFPAPTANPLEGERQVFVPCDLGRRLDQGDQPSPIDRVGPRTREPVKGSPPRTTTVPGDPPALERLRDLSPGVQPRATSTTKVAVVGRVTSTAVERLLGWPVDFAPGVETAAELGRTLPIARGDRVLLPQSALAGPGLAAILRGRGAVVTDVAAYETVVGTGGVDLVALLAAGEVDAVCFTSGSTIRGYLDRLGGGAPPGDVRVACIGTETAGVARSLGLRVDVVPDRPTVRAMVEALAAHFASNDR